MAGHRQPSMHGKPSVKRKRKPLEGPSADFADASRACIFSDDVGCVKKKCNSKSSEILSTTELISVVGQLWDCANQSLALLQPKAKVYRSDTVSQKYDILCNLSQTKKFDNVNSRVFPVDSKSSSFSPCFVETSLNCLRSSQKISYKPCSDHFIFSFPRTNRQDFHISPKTGKGLAAVGISHDLKNIYRWMSHIPLSRPNFSVPSTCKNKEKIYHISDAASISRSPITVNKASPSNNLMTSCDDGSADMTEFRHSQDNANVAKNTRVPICSLYSDYFLRNVETHRLTRVSNHSSLGLYADYHLSIGASCCTHEPCASKIEDDGLSMHKMDMYKKLGTGDELQTESCLSEIYEPRHSFAKQEHAVSGALAGIFVSLCLHPVDTIKTVLQSSRADQRSISYVSQSIISERGLTGLYRGITSNIATSAPISAIYTFTYETVKGVLLPSLPKEHHSFAHCTAGGCASIATSFIFTPSECIKQQMQVSSHYQSCWNALVKIVEKGGLPSLYAGWRAVLCRNIPHSIIKFYTYERLKQLTFSSEQPNAAQTLVCGALAGSTAALFSTPFDVVKTRLQTQIPGCVGRYGSVFNALRDIQKHEGLKGLYRGLTPRLVMYMTQGALFFASYEFFKSLLSLDLPKQSAQIVHHGQDKDNGSLLSSSPS